MKVKLIIGWLFFISIYSCSQTKDCKPEKEYFPNGKVQYEGCKKNGKREGQWFEYVEYNNKYYLGYVWNYVNGDKSGPYKAFHENQQIAAIGQYKNGSMNDTFKIYDKKGNLDKIEVWISDGGGFAHSDYQKKIYKNPKPENTIETIDGKKYIWKHEERFEIISTIPK